MAYDSRTDRATQTDERRATRGAKYRRGHEKRQASRSAVRNTLVRGL